MAMELQAQIQHKDTDIRALQVCASGCCCYVIESDDLKIASSLCIFSNQIELGAKVSVIQLLVFVPHVVEQRRYGSRDSAQRYRDQRPSGMCVLG